MEPRPNFLALSRRDFLKTAACLTVGSVVVGSPGRPAPAVRHPASAAGKVAPATERALRVAITVPLRPILSVRHAPAKDVQAGQPLAVALNCEAPPPRRVVLDYRTLTNPSVGNLSNSRAANPTSTVEFPRPTSLVALHCNIPLKSKQSTLQRRFFRRSPPISRTCLTSLSAGHDLDSHYDNIEVYLNFL